MLSCSLRTRVVSEGATREFFFVRLLIFEMSKAVLNNAFLPSGNLADIAIDQGRIAAIQKAGSLAADSGIDCRRRCVLPGFIDIHNHGAKGIDVNEADADGLLEIGRFLLSNGVCGWVPTIVPDEDTAYCRVISAVEKAMEISATMPVARILGVHYEGIFANKNMCGALQPEYFRTYSGTELESLPVPASGGRIMTFAPEISGGVDLATDLSRSGWIGAIGHTDSNPETLERAFSAGARHFTHFFNAMSGIHHRKIGVAGWALTEPLATIDIIADGVHIAKRLLDFAIRSKTPEHTLLISDSVAPTGLGDGAFTLWGDEINVEGRRTLGPNGGIAGSVITMLDAARSVYELGFNLQEIAFMSARNPARLLGIDGDTGTIEVGKRADLVVLGPDFQIDMVFIGGQIVGGPHD